MDCVTLVELENPDVEKLVFRMTISAVSAYKNDLLIGSILYQSHQLPFPNFLTPGKDNALV
jgi:hypothetical protein